MLIEWMDVFYITMIGIIFAFIIHIETELHTIKTMIEEVIKFKMNLKELRTVTGTKVKTHLRETAIHSIMVIHYGEVLCHLLKT